MQIFVIPSWFPTQDYPLSGILIKEQIEAFCETYPDVNMGISVWGNTEIKYLLMAKDHVKNLHKIFFANRAPFQNKLLPNLTSYHKPAFTWTRRLHHGNIKGIIKANLHNLRAFEADYGPVDVIHAHLGFPAGYIAMELGRQLNIPYCITEHMGPFPKLQTQRQKVVTTFALQPYQKAAINLAVSPFQEQVMRQQNISNVVTIPNFINEHFFKPAPQSQHHPANFTFFSLSFISSQKGTDVLLHAIKRLTLVHQEVEFRIGGDGPFLSTCKALAQKLEIDQYVVWLGQLEHEAALLEYQHCDTFVLPSLYESMGVVYIEALACGKPIIATRCGGPESTVVPLNGLLVEKNNPQALADAMHQMILNRHQYNSQKIRQDFLDRFSTQAVAPRLLSLYKEVIHRHTAG